MSAETLDLWVYDLAHLPNEVIAHALARVRREIKGRDGFKPVWALCDVLDRAGVVNTAAVEDAEARVAWDAVLDFSKKYISKDSEGSFYVKAKIRRTGEVRIEPERVTNGLVQIGRRQVCNCRPVHIVETIGIPDLGPRIIDSLRRIGGWTVIIQMDPTRDQPHVQRRFFEEFRSWQASEAAINHGSLPAQVRESVQNLSAAKAMDGQKQLRE